MVKMLFPYFDQHKEISFLLDSKIQFSYPLRHQARFSFVAGDLGIENIYTLGILDPLTLGDIDSLTLRDLS